MKNFLLVACILVSGVYFAQIKVSGKVKFKGKGIQNINVSLKETYDGATSNEKGEYTFSTTEKGNFVLVFSSPKYISVQRPVVLGDKDVEVNVDLKEDVNEIDVVVISAGSIEASDSKRATARLTPLDVYTTAGADGQVSSALNFLPGTQKVGESEGLFIRGGSGTESKIFMDGSLVNTYFTNSTPGIAGRDRFNTSLFKGNVFSSGGYSALYGQALSGVLLLESVDLPANSSYDFGISPVFLSAGFQKLSPTKTHSYGVSLNYSNLTPATKLLNFNTNFSKAPTSFSGNANFRIKNKAGGIWKYYGSFDQGKVALTSPSLEPDYQANGTDLNSSNSFHTVSFRQKFGRITFNANTSFTYNRAKFAFTQINENQKVGEIHLDQNQKYANAKMVFERAIGKISKARAGLEWNTTDETTAYSGFAARFQDTIYSLFAETDLGFSKNLSAKIGLRAERSSYLDKYNIAPRFSMAYRLSEDWVTSFAYGIFYQNPESRYLNTSFKPNFQKASHYILQLARNTSGRTLRMEGFYKKYDQLIKTQGTTNFAPSIAVSNAGNGDAKGIEFFWRDRKTLKNIDYWVSYSFLDTQRNYLNYPTRLVPNFASKHTLSLVGKKFVTSWKTGFNLSYTYAKGRPYYDIISENGESTIRNEGRLKDYNALNFSLNYLPNLGKKDAKAFTVLVLSVTNVLGNKNVYGYNFSSDGLRNSAIVPPVNTFVFVGAFISIGVDKTEDAINNNL